MSIPDSISSTSVTVSPSLSTASETHTAPVNTAIPPPSQPPPAPPPPPRSQLPPAPLPPPLPTYRPKARVRHPNPLQHDHNYRFAQSIPIRPRNQDPSAVLNPFAPQGRGFSARPVRRFFADKDGHPYRPGVAYNQQLFGPIQTESMMQFMRDGISQIHQLPYFRSGPGRGSPQFLQPRVAAPQTVILDTSRNRKARSKDEDLVLVCGRKVRITEGASLNSLCRSWVINGGAHRIQPQSSGTMEPLPKPAPVDMTETSVPDDPAEEDEEDVKDLSEEDLLKRHIERAKKVRARLRQERSRKIQRYKERIELVLANSR